MPKPYVAPMAKSFRSALGALMLASAVPAAAANSPVGKWLAEDIRGDGVIDNLQTTLEIKEDGSVLGSGGCNRYRGLAQITGQAIKFGANLAGNMAARASSQALELYKASTGTAALPPSTPLTP